MAEKELARLSADVKRLWAQTAADKNLQNRVHKVVLLFDEVIKRRALTCLEESENILVELAVFETELSNYQMETRANAYQCRPLCKPNENLQKTITTSAFGKLFLRCVWRVDCR